MIKKSDFHMDGLAPSGITSENILLLIFAVFFTPCHILIRYKNVILK